MRQWRHSGFSVHNRIRTQAADAEGRQRLARYMIRCPFALNCGLPFQMLVEGRWITVYGWQGLRMHRYPTLGRRLAAVCDVPDLTLLPSCVPSVQTVSFHAALESWTEQLSLWLMACLSRLRVVQDWSKMSRSFTRLSERTMIFASDRGGMRVRISGSDAGGKRRVLGWYLIANENHGPEIPCTPSSVLVKKLLSEEMLLRGAHQCMGMLSIDELIAEMSDFAISSETVSEPKG